MAELNEKSIKQYAAIFADVFKRQGVLSANTPSLDSNANIQSNDAFSNYKEQKLKEKLLKKNNSLLDEFLDIQKDVNDNIGDHNKNLERQKKIEKELQSDSILLGKSYTSAVKAFKDGKINSNDLKQFTGTDDLDKLSKDFGDKIEDAGDTMSDSIVDSAEKIHTKTDRAITKMLTLLKPGAMLGLSFNHFVGEFRAGLKYGTDLTENVISRQANSLKMAISPADLIELEARNKRLVNAFGGAANFEETIKDGGHALFKFYGDLGEASKGTIQALNALSLGGIKPSLDAMASQNGAMSSLTKTMFEIRSLTGQTFAEQNAAMEEYIKSDTAKAKLVSLGNSKERFALIQRDQRNKALFAALGLTAEQATRVSESFNSIAGLNPKDRLKESFKAQAVAAAMGIENAHLIGEVYRAGGIQNIKEADKVIKYTKAIEELSIKQAESVSGEITTRNLVNDALFGHAGVLKEQVIASRDLALANKEAGAAAKTRAAEELKNLNDSKFIETMSTGLKGADILKAGLAGNASLTAIFGAIGAGTVIAKLVLAATLANGLGGKASKLGKAKNSLKGLGGKAVEGLKNAKAGIGRVATSGASLARTGASALGGIGLGTVAAGAVAAFAVQQTYKAVTTGKSDIYDALGTGIQTFLVDTIESTVDAFSSESANGGGTRKGRRKSGTLVDRTRQTTIETKENKKAADASTKMLKMQEQMISLNQKNSELMEKNNEILASNFEKMHSANTKHLKSNDAIKNVLQDNSNEDIQLATFDDNSTSVV